MAYKCRAQTEDGTLCKNPVSGPDQRCHHHRGRPAGRVPAPPRRSATRAPSRGQPGRRTTPRRAMPARATHHRGDQGGSARAARERRRLESAAALCADIAGQGGTAVIAERATAYVSEEMWGQLVKSHRRSGCGDLAKLARAILEGKKRLHDIVGHAAGGLFARVNRSRIGRAFAYELATRIPLPVDAQLSAAARGLQAAGICICMMGNGSLTDCACLRDVLKTEGEARLKQLMKGALQDWQGLPERTGLAGG